jgi:uncharacterized protein YjbI with pentapeptide repeats
MGLNPSCNGCTDELFMVEGLTNNEITEFIIQVSKITNQKPKLHLIITSRFHYVDLKKLSKDKALIFSLAPLNFNEQKQWIEYYQKVYPDCNLNEEQLIHINNPDNIQFKEIRELINQPILLYLVAKANFDITSGVNRSIIYNNLFDAMINRTWEESGQLEKFDNFNVTDFRNFIGAIALKIYHSEHEFIYKSELLEMDEFKEFVEYNFKADFKKIENSVSDVLISFYFQNVDDTRLTDVISKPQEYAIEFYHKSLQEYLSAERIWNIFLEKFLEKKQNKRYILDKWEDALKLISDLVSTKGLTSEVSKYLREGISNFSNKSRKKELFNRLIRFFPDLCNCGFIYSYQSSIDSNSPIVKAAESFYIYYTIISSIDKIPFTIRINRNNRLKELIYIKQLINPDFFNLSGIDFSDLDFSGVDLFQADLFQTDFHRAILSGANLSGANLNGANLNGANLETAELLEANLEGAFLYGTNLSVANLIGANLIGANLIGANLEEANLKKANLMGANLERAVLLKTDLSGADLSGINLQGVNLEGANLEGVNLEGANLEEANLRKANLRKANLMGAKISGANLERADLEGANLERAKLLGANLMEANLIGASLDKAFHMGAKLQGAKLDKKN